MYSDNSGSGEWSMIKYIGNGSYYQGIPARDLTEEEWNAIPRRRRKRLLEFGLYAEQIKRKPVKKEVEVTENADS